MYGITLTRAQYDAVDRLFQSIHRNGVQQVKFGSLVDGKGETFVTLAFIGFGQRDEFHIAESGDSAPVEEDGESEFSRVVDRPPFGSDPTGFTRV